MVETAERDLPADAGVDGSFDPILLPVGRSDADRIESLAATAAETSGMMQTAVHVLHVFSPSRFERLADGPAESADPDAVAKQVDPVDALTDELSGPLRDWGMPMTVEGRVSDSLSDEIVAAADDIGAKRVLVSGRRRTPTGKAVFGSTAQQVLLDAPCPVTFIRDD